MTDVVVDRLHIRGAGARRLATVAARTLPAALEAALADLADGAVDHLTVTLDLDPADYDDATLALLWADRIRGAALAAGVPRRAAPATAPGAPGPGPADDAGGATDGSAGGGVRSVAVLVAWLEAGAPAAGVPLAVGRLADREHAAGVVALLGPAHAAALTAALRRAAQRTGRHRPPGSGATDVPARSAAVAAAPPPGPVPAEAPGEPSTRRHRHAADPQDPTGDVVRASAALRTHLEVAAATGRTLVDLDLATRVAGVVLCYPWLADLCRTGEALLPGTDPTHVRRVALAALAGGWLADTSPARGALVDPALLDDPLVLLLAGAAEDATPHGTLAPLPAGPLAAAADDVLARFAGLLHGFERSTPGFVRASWIVRAGLLDAGSDPVRLLAQRLPLDVVLGQLPYPVTLLRLPWSPPLTVRFRP